MSVSIFKKYAVIPFEKRGCSFNGCNCYGFVKLWYKHELGIELNSYSLCPSEIADDFIESEASSLFVRVKDYQDHDALIILDSDQKPKHTGIFFNNHVLHMTKNNGFMIENFRKIKPRIVSIHRYKYETAAD